MTFDKTPSGCLVIKHPFFEDSRGSFFELFKESKLPDIPPLKQWNVSTSSTGAVRGMHFQKTKPQGKFIRALSGVIWDCVIDLRRESPTFGTKESFLLCEDSYSVYIPPGFAHGFYVSAGPAIFLYGCTEEYDPTDEGGINPLDNGVRFPWEFDKENLTISEKDRRLPSYEEVLKERW